MFAGAWFSGLGVNHDLDFAEVDRVAFRLEADTAALNQKVFSVFNKWFGGLVAWVVLWLGITENGFAIDLVLDHLRALHYDLSDNPLLAMHGVGSRIDAVGLFQLIFHHHMGARGAKVCVRTPGRCGPDGAASWRRWRAALHGLGDPAH